MEATVARGVISHGRWSVLINCEIWNHGGYVGSSVHFKGKLCGGRVKKKYLRAHADAGFLSFLEIDLNNSISSLRDFVTAVPNAPAITVLAVALTAVGRSIAAKKGPVRETKVPDWIDEGGSSGYWILTLNPTPFNKFIIARCPSICFDSFCNTGEDIYLKLNLENHQVVNVRSKNVEPAQGAVVYQRRCIRTEDGGSLALDWPTFLDIEGDHGLDTTLLLIPGTAKGSEDINLNIFVEAALQSGHFPVILNPRGCGNSPLTTPRLYTAGDSDDVREAVSYIARSRPWTTLMGIAWGFGANMLAKYLGEEENLTPMTAAVCINNPFDLNEATKYMKSKGGLDKELTDGFVGILKTNKVLFEGLRSKIDIPGGLTATSVREFEGAISSPANGFQSLETFYETVSSGKLIDHVKVPLLCIQDSSTAPSFSIPQSAFEGNPYTTLLYTTMEPKNVDCNISFNLALEWLAAVEIALLKGRHPLLQGVDLTVKPSKEWNRNFANALIEAENDYITVEPRQDFWVAEEKDDDGPGEMVLKGKLPEHADDKVDDATQEEKHEGKEEGNRAVKSSKESDQEGDKAPEENATEDQGQVQQAAQTIFSALDSAMPGTLSDETKTQVLDAVGRGETLITALQNAVPEDVRGKMVSAVSAAVQARGMSLQMVGFGKSLPPPAIPAGLMESIQEKLGSVATSGLTASDNSSGSVDGNHHTEETKNQANNVLIPDLPQSDKANAEGEAASHSNGAAVPDEKTEVAQNDDQEKNPKPQIESTGQNQEATKSVQPSAESKSSTGATSSINMQQALQALTGLDDSTQMAVNNVFGVLEGMLEQIEKEREEDVGQKQQNTAQEQAPNVADPEHHQNGSVTSHVEVTAEGQKRHLKSELMVKQKGGQQQTEQMDELKDVQTRLKRTKISGFILQGGKKSRESPGHELPNEKTKPENVVLEAMKVEVQRRIRASSLDPYPDLTKELSNVADAVMREVRHVHTDKESSSRKVLSAESLVNAVDSAFRETVILKQVVPFGVLVGVILASLVNSFMVIKTEEESWQRTEMISDVSKNQTTSATLENKGSNEQKSGQGFGGKVVGAMTAAMGATAALATGRGGPTKENKEHADEAHDDDCYKENFVNNIADKAFSMAAPVVPTKHGQIDHERLVSMLAELGQKASFLNFLGKAALLWGGLRGAMSVTERLLVFFRIAERPLHQRLLGFAGMVLLLWSPIVLPLLPSLLNEWASRSSGGVARWASSIGLYGALIILVTIWGKKIRGYEQPLQAYGLHLEKLNLFGAGLAAGCGAVSLLYATFYQLGYLRFVSSFMVTTSFSQVVLSAAKLGKLMAEAMALGLSIATVEEVLFRSWLFEEIAADLGHHKAIILSGLVFAILHWSPSAVPGLWFLAIALAGSRLKTGGSLALPIGLHAGLIAANFVFTCGGFIAYSPAAPRWITGVHAGSPLAGVLGASAAAVFAILLYPWKFLIELNNKQAAS